MGCRSLLIDLANLPIANFSPALASRKADTTAAPAPIAASPANPHQHAEQPAADLATSI
jgi:hypothetical protein